MIRTELGSRYLVTAFRHGAGYAAYVRDLQLDKTHELRVGQCERIAVERALEAARLDPNRNAGEWEIQRPKGLD